MHSFAATCGLTVTAVLGAENDFNHELQGFEQQCLENADPRVFLDAIMSADCSEAQGGAQHTETDVIPLFLAVFLDRANAFLLLLLSRGGAKVSREKPP